MAETMTPTMGGREAPASDTSKLLAALGYPIFIVALIAILIEPYKEEKFVKFHAIQALALALAYIVVEAVLSVIPVLGWIVAAILPLVYLIYTIILAMKAYKGEYFEVPVVYGFAKGMMGE
jgi:uncharacterized membrane protein